MTYIPVSLSLEITGTSGAIPIYDDGGLTSDYDNFSYDKTAHTLDVNTLRVRGSGDLFYVGGPIMASGKVNCLGRIGPLKVNSDNTTITFDMNVSDYHEVVLGGNRALAVTNVGENQRFIISLIQDGSGSRTVTWFNGIKWPSNTTPTLTTTPNKEDYFTFITRGSGVYRGFVSGLNYGD